MKKAAIAMGVLGLVMSASAALAQTCADAPEIYSNSSFNGDTCAATNSLPGYGVIPSPQSEIVYHFVADSAMATIQLTHDGAPFGATMFLMPSPCHSSTDPIAFGDFDHPMDVNGLTDGATYYVIVTADPGGPADACGAFSVQVNGQLPVELQSFDVE